MVRTRSCKRAGAFLCLCLYGLVGEPLSTGFSKSSDGALAIRHLALIPAKIELSEVERQMFFADVVECPDDAALQERKAALDGVRMDGEIVFLADVFTGTVIDAVMRVSAGNIAVSWKAITHHFGTFFDVLDHRGLKVGAGDALHDHAALASVALHERYHGHLVRVRAGASAPRLAEWGHLAANVGFVHFDHAVQLLTVADFFQRMADAMGHEKRGAIAAEIEYALHLEAAHALL